MIGLALELAPLQVALQVIESLRLASTPPPAAQYVDTTASDVRPLKQPAATRLARKDPQRALNGTAVTRGWVSAVDSEGRTIWIADAHRDDRKRFVVRGAQNYWIFPALTLARYLREIAEK